ncbi:MAG: hypothetical protein ACE5HH_05730 [Candidatus Hydrothermarchaeales archaeon]
METEEKISAVVRAVGILLILVGVTGVISGIYALTLVNDYAGSNLSTRQASKSVIDATLLLSKDTDEIKGSLLDTGDDLEEASKKIEGASAGLSDTSASLEGYSTNIDAAADSMASSAQADKDAAAQLLASADAIEAVSPETGDKLRAAGRKIEESGNDMNATSASLKKASLKIKEASAKLKDSSEELKGVSVNLNDTSGSIGSVASSFEGMTTRLTTNLNDLVEGLQLLDTVGDKKTLLYEVVIYFIVVHLLFAGTGVALLLMAGNLYGW